VIGSVQTVMVRHRELAMVPIAGSGVLMLRPHLAALV